MQPIASTLLSSLAVALALRATVGPDRGPERMEHGTPGPVELPAVSGGTANGAG